MEIIPNLLIVDDNPVNLQYLEVLLKDFKINLLQASNGIEALEKADGVELSLAILDVRMPQMDGYELASRLNSNSFKEKVPIIFLSAYYPDDMHLLEGYSAGAVDYLTKPINSHILLCKIKVFLELFDQKQKIKIVAEELRLNVDELSRMHEALKTSDTKYRMFIDFATDAFFQADNCGNILTVNEQATKLCGYSKEELAGLNITSFFSKEELLNKPLRFDLLNAGEILKSERLMIHKDGSLVPVEMNSRQMIDGTYQSFVRDITSRMKAENALRESERKLSTLMNNLKGIVYACLKDRDWTMIFVSDGSLELTGYAPDELVNNRVKSYNDIIYPDDRQSVWDQVQNAITPTDIFTLEYRIVTKSGIVKWVWERGRGVFSDEGRLLHFEGFIADITERKRSEILKKALFNISGAVVSDYNIQDFVVVVREELGALLNTENFYIIFYNDKSGIYSRPEASGDRYETEQWHVQKALVGKVIKANNSLLVNENEIQELIRLRKIDYQGSIPKIWLGVPLIINGKPIGAMVVENYKQSDAYTSLDLDVLESAAHEVCLCIEKINNESEIINSHKALLDLHMHLEDIREGERKKIALDLHDDLGQKLTALNMELMWLNRNVPPEMHHLSDKIGSMKSLLSETITTVQKISAGLRPSILDVLGLVAAIRWQLNEFGKNTAIKCYSRISPEQFEIDSKLSITIFRIIQEALTNVARHANATKVNLVMIMENDQIQLTITDNGIGIDKEKVMSFHSFGLLGMKERVASCGGTLSITGKAGKGTHVSIRIPLIHTEP